MITINPKFQSLIPPLSSEELAQLETNIKADGCRDPLVTWRGVLIDGHNRHAICSRLGLTYQTRSVELPDEDAAQVWIIRNQFGRRNITLASRCELAEKLAEALRPKALENQSKAGNPLGRKDSAFPNIGESTPIDTLKDAAKEAGVSHGSLAAFRFLKANAAPEELAELKSNPNAKLHRVVKEVKERQQKEARQEKRIESARGTQLDQRIIVGDFRDHVGTIADGSLSLIFTDPPYDREAESLFPGLANFAASKLADGGSLIMYLGHLQLPAAFAAFHGKLRHWWTCACVHSGASVIMREYGIRVGWKPMLWFVKRSREDKSEIVLDVVTGAVEKTHHDWQQAQSEAEYWIGKLCPRDGIVCDPFLGGGTTGAAAQKLGRKWIGFEINPENAKIASGRLAK